MYMVHSDRKAVTMLTTIPALSPVLEIAFCTHKTISGHLFRICRHTRELTLQQGCHSTEKPAGFTYRQCQHDLPNLGRRNCQEGCDAWHNQASKG